MLKVRFTNQFKKDYKLALKRGCKEETFLEVLNKLLNQEPLPEKKQRPRSKRNTFNFC